MVTPTLEMGGMERLIVSMAQAYRARGLDVQVTALESAGTLGDEARRLGIPVTVIPTPGLKTNLSAPALAAHFSRRQLDVVHAHSGVWLKAARAARAAGVPGVVHTFHGIVQNEPWYNDVLRRVAAWSTDRVVAVSESLAERLVQRCGISRARVEVVINGVDTTRFSPGERDAARASLGVEAGAFVVGHVARLDPIKNQAMLLRAFAEFHATAPESVLVLIGNGVMRASLEALAAQLNVQPWVRFAGEVTDAAPLYRAFDVFALSSVLEGTSMSILEAMATGIPVVATAVGGTPALTRQGQLARQVPHDDAPAMARAFRELRDDATGRASLADASLDVVRSTYSEQAMLDRYLAIYEAVSHSGAPR